MVERQEEYLLNKDFRYYWTTDISISTKQRNITCSFSKIYVWWCAVGFFLMVQEKVGKHLLHVRCASSGGRHSSL